MKTNNIYRFRLSGVEYTLCGDKTSSEMELIVGLVEQKVKEIREHNPGYSTIRSMTLAALQLAEELYDARRDYTSLLSEEDIGAEYDIYDIQDIR